VALANNLGQTANIPIIIHNASTGATVATGSITLPPWGHTSFVLASKFPVTAGTNGTVEFGMSGGQVSVLGLRVNSNDAFTSVPAVPRQ
jgi:hypothetical protein